ncbi:MAG: glycosyltransferase family 2 protein [Actinomycetota bacterium]|nr:glycosyltransferase family 2 protein [Actinomycetota bacterium]
MKPEVSIVILNWNAKTEILECLESLSKLSYSNFQIIVVDNGSTDDSVNAIKKRFPLINLVELSRNCGFAGGNNEGIRLALEMGSKYVLLLNNDTIVEDADFLDSLVCFAESVADAGIIGPLILYEDGETVWFAGGKLSVFFGTCIHRGKRRRKHAFKRAQPSPVEYITGCAMLVRTDVFETIGLLEERYFLYWEDADFCFRARANGYNCYIVPGCSIRHKKSTSAGTKGKDRLTEFQAYNQAKGAVVFAHHNLGRIERAAFLFAQFSTRLLYVLVVSRSFKVMDKHISGVIEALGSVRSSTG